MAAHADDGETTLESALEELREHYEVDGHGVELIEVGGGWQILTRPEYTEAIERAQLAARPQRLSAAALETLAIIAYRQPVTRGDIEDVRGVAVSPPTLKALEERGWIEAVGHRETPGRPALFATTRKFLDDLNLRSLEELPPLEELQSTLEPQPTLAGIEADTAPQQESLIADEPSTEEASAPSDEPDAQGDEANAQQEPEEHAG